MSRLIAVIGLAILVLAGASAVDASFIAAGDHTSIDNESFAPSAGTNTFNHSQKANVTYDSASDIEIRHNSTVVRHGGNYSWERTNGTADIINNSYLENQSGANIDYGYSASSQQTRQLAALFGNGLDVAQMLIIVLLAGFMFAGMRAFGGV